MKKKYDLLQRDYTEDAYKKVYYLATHPDDVTDVDDLRYALIYRLLLRDGESLALSDEDVVSMCFDGSFNIDDQHSLNHNPAYYGLDEHSYYTEEIPDWAMAFFEDGSTDGMSDSEIETVKEFESEYDSIVQLEQNNHEPQEPGFVWRPAFGLAGNCYTCFCVKANKTENE